MSATMFDRTAALEDEVAVTIPLPSRRSRRLSLPSTMPSSLRRRSRLPIPSPSDGESTVSDKAMPHIPFASPPYMPMFGASSSSSSLVSSPPSRTKADIRRSMPISLLPVSTTPSTPSQTSNRPRHQRTESSRFRRRLARWTSSSSRDQLDFGCAGNNGNSNWLEGPQDLGDTFYSQYPGTAKRGSTSSVESPTGPWMHARGESTSSTLSTASTAASSMPNSPVLRHSGKLRPSPSFEFASAPSSIRSSTPATQRKIEEEAAIEAVNDHFRRIRLSQLEQHRAQALSQFTFPQRPPLDVALSETKPHRRSRSDELEIEFLESGHSTFTPLDAHSEAGGDESIYISYDDLSDSSTFCAADVTPVPRMTFDAIPEADETAISSASSSARPSLAEATVLAPGIEEDLVPALEELSDYFVSTLASDASSASTTAAVTPIEWTPAPILPLAPTRRKAAAVSAPDLSTFAFPPKERTPPILSQHHRGNSTASLPCTATPRSPSMPSRHKRGESASFVAAQRSRLVAAGRVKPNATERQLLKERHSLYDWI